MFIAVCVLAWLGCSFLTYGFTLGEFSHLWPDQSNVEFVIPFSLFSGPIGLLISAADGRFKYWQLVPYTREQRWEFFDKKFPSLGREYFDQRR